MRDVLAGAARDSAPIGASGGGDGDGAVAQASEPAPLQEPLGVAPDLLWALAPAFVAAGQER